MTPKEQTMTERSVTHDTFALEREYEASPERTYAAWAEPEAKAGWFPIAASEDSGYEFDFKVGGREVGSGSVEGSTYTYEAIYQDIVPNERIVYSYDMHMDGTRISVSLATVELKPSGDGTRLVFTEQGAFLDGLDTADQRRQGTGSLLDALGEELARER
jgi:uncharacterized protein YndB with AHSA1/START domain